MCIQAWVGDSNEYSRIQKHYMRNGRVTEGEKGFFIVELCINIYSSIFALITITIINSTWRREKITERNDLVRKWRVKNVENYGGFTHQFVELIIIIIIIWKEWARKKVIACLLLLFFPLFTFVLPLDLFFLHTILFQHIANILSPNESERERKKRSQPIESLYCHYVHHKNGRVSVIPPELPLN